MNPSTFHGWQRDTCYVVGSKPCVRERKKLEKQKQQQQWLAQTSAAGGVAGACRHVDTQIYIQNISQSRGK